MRSRSRLGRSTRRGVTAGCARVWGHLARKWIKRHFLVRRKTIEIEDGSGCGQADLEIRQFAAVSSSI
jgi:hypothetical protein